MSNRRSAATLVNWPETDSRTLETVADVGAYGVR
jgi:hypothetical protein